MTVLTAYARLKPGAVDQALAACAEVYAKTQGEPGCEKYDYFQNPRDPHLIVFVEEWTTREHLDVHLKLDHVQQFFAVLNPLLAQAPELRIFEAELQA